MNHFRRILVPLDGSHLAETALPVALVLAQKFHSQIILLRVVGSPRLVLNPVDPSSIYWWKKAVTQLHRKAERYLENQATILRQHECDVCTLVRTGAPANKIINVANEEKVDLIVMSTRGQGGVAHWTFGSLADKVMRHCSCPALLVRAGTHVEDIPSLEDLIQEAAWL